MEIKVKHFFKTLNREVLALELSGIYFSSEEIFSICNNLNLDIVMGVREDTLKELFEKASKKNLAEELKNELLKIAQDRVLQYQNILSKEYCENIDKLLFKSKEFITFLKEVKEIEG